MTDFPFQPHDEEGLVFNEPWEAQAFGLVLALHEQGLFSWNEWTTVLSREITEAQQAGDPDLGNTYYQHWLKALEHLVLEKKLSSISELDVRKNKWLRAYANTPHGKPIHLEAADR